MRFAIPNPPRKVRLGQVPGAMKRLALAGVGGLLLMVVLGGAGRLAAGALSLEREFHSRALQVPGQVLSVSLPPKEAREGAMGKLSVLYRFQDKERVASQVETLATYAEGLGPGAKVSLLVDPRYPDEPREERQARQQAPLVDLAAGALLLGGLLAVGWVGLEIRRTALADLRPLRQGLLVWLTPDGPLPQTRGEVRFLASYFRQDVRYQVKARVRPGRAPVRNGEKVLAAVVPSRPKWARVIDEDLAKTLGWVQD